MGYDIVISRDHLKLGPSNLWNWWWAGTRGDETRPEELLKFESISRTSLQLKYYDTTITTPTYWEFYLFMQRCMSAVVGAIPIRLDDLSSWKLIETTARSVYLPPPPFIVTFIVKVFINCRCNFSCRLLPGTRNRGNRLNSPVVRTQLFSAPANSQPPHCQFWISKFY